MSPSMPNRLQIVAAYLVWLSRLLTHLATYDLILLTRSTEESLITIKIS